MNCTSEVSDSSAQPSLEEDLIVEPFLHLMRTAIYNPMTDKTISTGDSAFDLLRGILRERFSVSDVSGDARTLLQNDGWLIKKHGLPTRRFNLKYVQIETNTTCNHACHFCPVSIAPRSRYLMPIPLFDSIMDQLRPFARGIEGVWLHHYNEPTTDHRLARFIRSVWDKGLVPCMNSNASGLSARKVGELMEAGGLGALTINLSTIDRARYKEERGVDQLDIVLKNLNHLKNIRLAPKMHIVVIGNGDEQEDRDFREISALFDGSFFEVYHYPHNNRAGGIETGMRGNIESGMIGGCDFKGSRPLQHLTIDAYGNVVLCCQDYHSDYKAGSLANQSLIDILEGENMARMRRWIYGLENAAADFICRKCPFALSAKEDVIVAWE